MINSGLLYSREKINYKNMRERSIYMCVKSHNLASEWYGDLNNLVDIEFCDFFHFFIDI